MQNFYRLIVLEYNVSKTSRKKKKKKSTENEQKLGIEELLDNWQIKRKNDNQEKHLETPDVPKAVTHLTLGYKNHILIYGLFFH